MLAIYKREMHAYLTSPIGYVFIAVFLAVNALFFSICTLLAGEGSSVSTYFTFLMWALFILIPMLTMKMFSEERKTRTEQLLLTAPISLTGMVMGKFLAAYSIFALTFIGGSLINFPLLYQFGTPNTAVIISLSAGILIIGAAFISMGMFISALTENQIVAAIGTMGVIFFTLMINLFNGFIDVYVIRVIINWISIVNRFANFGYGILDPAAILYYISLCVIFTFVTVRIYEKRRWS